MANGMLLPVVYCVLLITAYGILLSTADCMLLVVCCVPLSVAYCVFPVYPFSPPKVAYCGSIVAVCMPLELAGCMLLSAVGIGRGLERREPRGTRDDGSAGSGNFCLRSCSNLLIGGVSILR